MTRLPSFGWHLLSAAAYAVAAAGCYVVFVLLQRGQLIDVSSLGANVLDMGMEAQLEAFGLLRSGLIAVFGVLTVALGCVALFRGRWRLVLILFASCVATVLGVRLLRELLWRPDLGAGSYDYNTWPSGHVAAVCVLALACLRLAPDRPLWRWGFVVAAVVAVTVSAYASMVSFAHRPSDALGAIFICGALFALTRPRHGGPYRLGWAKLLVLPSAAAAAVLLGFPYSVSPTDPQAALALGALLGMFSAACWVLLPERLADRDEQLSRGSRTR